MGSHTTTTFIGLGYYSTSKVSGLGYYGTGNIKIAEITPPTIFWKKFCGLVADRLGQYRTSRRARVGA
eukprot:288128-Rhodomonas_salina.3